MPYCLNAPILELRGKKKYIIQLRLQEVLGQLLCRYFREMGMGRNCWVGESPRILEATSSQAANHQATEAASCINPYKRKIPPGLQQRHRKRARVRLN